MGESILQYDENATTALSGTLSQGSVGSSSAPLREVTEGKVGWSSDQDSFDEQVWIRATYGLIAVLGISGNLLVIFTVARVRALQTLTHLFIVSLAATDFITSVFLIPLNLGIKINVPSGIAGDIICRTFLSKFPLWTSFVASVLNLTCITLERYLSIVYPLRYDGIFTAKKAGIMIFFIWVVAILLNSYMLYIFFEDEGSCIISWPLGRWYQTLVGVANACVIYFIPLGGMGISYIQIMNSLRASANRLKHETRGGQESAMTLELLTARKKVIKMLATVVITFALCWAPNQIVFLGYNLGWNVDFGSWYYHCTVLIAFCNSCMNPLIYAFKSKKYRKALQKAICGKYVCSSKVGNADDTPTFINTVDVMGEDKQTARRKTMKIPEIKETA